MASRIRILLKAVAVGRYLISNQRISKISSNAKLFVCGEKSASEVVKEVIPICKKSIKERLKFRKVRKRIRWYLVACVLVGIASVEYNRNCNIVPITHRRHFAIMPREFELRYHDSLVANLEKKFSETTDGVTVSMILPASDERVQFINKIVHRLQDACVYYSPECKHYMDNMTIIVVNDDEINAYSTMGSVIVVNTGVIDHFKKLQENGDVANYEECIAGVLAHELSHALSRHPVETMLRWSGFAYYIYITLVPDLIVMPVVKGIYDKKICREQEHEADLQSLYLLKRSGYDPSSMITTLSLLPDDIDDDVEIVSKTKEIVQDHPRIVNRVTYLQDNMFAFQKNYKKNYEIKQEKEVDIKKGFFNYIISFTKAIW